MATSTGRLAQHLLDEVRRPAHIEAFSVDGYLEHLAREVDEVGHDRVAREARLHAALAALHAFASQVMAIRLDYLSPDHAALERPFRKYLASRVLDYAGDLERLRARVAEVASRGEPAGASSLAAAVVAAAGEVVALCTRLRAGVVALMPPEEPPEDPEQEPHVPTRAELIELD